MLRWAGVGNRGLLQGAGILGGGEYLPATAVARATAPAASTATFQRGSALLNAGVPMVRWLAEVMAGRETGNGIEVAPPWLAGVLALAFKAERQARPPSDCARFTRPDSAHGDREPLVGSTADPSRAGQARLPRFRPKHCKVYASSVGWGAFCGLAYVSSSNTHRPSGGKFSTSRTTQHPTAEWTSRQIIECCAWDRGPPHFLIHDRDGRHGAAFDQWMRNLGISQIRTPFRSPQANSIAERWVRSLRRECLDHLFIFNERHLRSALSIAGARTARSVSAPHAESNRRSAKHATARSSGSPCLAAYITSIIWRHDALDILSAPHKRRE